MATEGKGPLYDNTASTSESGTSSSKSDSQSAGTPAFSAELSNHASKSQDLTSGNVFQGSEGAQASESPFKTKSQLKFRRMKSEKKGDKTERNASGMQRSLKSQEQVAMRLRRLGLCMTDKT
ncbi:hypothetical protein P389DRAFT_175519 [Cystobasidium minutum MCA 4210]|uniref:uncharacterized protein n=1 Tax=Cystobasidium minutum MCA 4210 TaxID=1397322 RepID=UPI0034CDC356|eukprot:jgi/Rhomi1/175519/fgenesh1_kg.11_\